MIKMTLAEAADIVGATQPAADRNFSGLSKDSRTIQPDNLYVAIIGESLDGHDYVEEAYKKGAAAVIVSRPVAASLPQIIVTDTILAMGKLAANWRDRFNPAIAGITGSNGKTTLKNMVASILVASCNNETSQVLATVGNLNNAIGLPLMLSNLNNKHRYAAIEMGMNSFGEIEYLTKMTRPSVAVINNAAEAHLQGLADVAGVARAKGEIFLGLQENGIAVLNKEDKHFDYWRGLLGDRSYVTFALSSAADVTATFVPSEDTLHQLVNITTTQGEFDVNLPLLGEHNVKNALAATAVGIAMGISLNAIKTGLETVQAAPGRMNQHLLANNLRVIDDTYNANPFSTTAAINALALFSGKKILVLADMRELGPDAAALHEEIGVKARTAGIDYLFTFGELTLSTTQGFGANAQHFTDQEKLVEALQPFLQSGTTVLVKGSRSMKMEKVIAQLLPESAHQAAH
jgi:UDP-N-acetylmuramoyl-tripeptide--D-alanyl-D-alanine ligase